MHFCVGMLSLVLCRDEPDSRETMLRTCKRHEKMMLYPTDVYCTWYYGMLQEAQGSIS